MGGSEFIAVFLLIIITVGGGYFLKTLLKKYHSIDKQPSRRTQYNSNSDNGPKKKTKSQEKDYSELNKEIEEVTNWIGVSEAVNTSEMFDKVADGKEEEVINEIARQLSMPMKITLKMVLILLLRLLLGISPVMVAIDLRVIHVLSCFTLDIILVQTVLFMLLLTNFVTMYCSL